MALITSTAKSVLAKREALAIAEQELAQAEASFKLELAKEGVDYAVVDGVKVAVVRGERPSYSVELLKGLVSDKVFKTVTKFAVDGKKFKSLKRHLRTQYNMSPEQYREKWGLPADYPMVAPNYANSRSNLAKNMGLGQRKAR